ncbi:hypothetical protein INR49_015308 [Caranx melampygus]|nr:hypothetical protein INR49_015308 [Caranx melampygus]
MAPVASMEEEEPQSNGEQKTTRDSEPPPAAEPPSKRVKIEETFQLSEQQQQLIREDTANKKLWDEAMEHLKEGPNFLRKMEQIFMCVCCQELAFQPITTICSHNVCKTCLQRSFRAKVYTCPACRHDLGKDYVMIQNKTLQMLLDQFFPGYSKGRLHKTDTRHIITCIFLPSGIFRSLDPCQPVLIFVYHLLTSLGITPSPGHELIKRKRNCLTRGKVSEHFQRTEIGSCVQFVWGVLDDNLAPLLSSGFKQTKLPRLKCTGKRNRFAFFPVLIWYFKMSKVGRSDGNSNNDNKKNTSHGERIAGSRPSALICESGQRSPGVLKLRYDIQKKLFQHSSPTPPHPTPFIDTITFTCNSLRGKAMFSVELRHRRLHMRLFCSFVLIALRSLSAVTFAPLPLLSFRCLLLSTLDYEGKAGSGWENIQWEEKGEVRMGRRGCPESYSSSEESLSKL